jgi:hypothetical protein
MLITTVVMLAGLSLEQKTQQKPKTAGMCLAKNRVYSVAGVAIPANLVGNTKQSLDYAMSKIQLPRTNNLQSDCLTAHNKYRELVGRQPLTFSAAAQQVAQNWANRLAATNSFEHSYTKGYGENLYRKTGGSSSCADAVTAWFEEYPYYPSGMKIGDGDFHAYGHFTQLIWPATTQVGCAKASNGPSTTYVCEYLPPGNMMGQRLQYSIPRN